MTATAVAVKPTERVVPRLWPGETVICLGTGPSLTKEDIVYCMGRARVIAIKDAIRMAPGADVLYACGSDSSKWWQRHGPSLVGFMVLRFTLDPQASQWATVLRNTGPSGLEASPTGLRNGRNSGYQAINLAVHLGAAKIVLLGYDMQPSDGKDHFFGNHPHGAKPPFGDFRPFFKTLVEPLRERGVTIINASRRTALDCFPRLTLEEALG